MSPIRQSMHDESGFTFLELIIVLFIFAALASVILFRFSDFTSSVSRGNLAQDVALTIKEAQSDSVSGRYAVQFGNLRPSYGVFFEQTEADRFAYFVDYFNGVQDGLFAPREIPAFCEVLDNECLDIIQIQRQDRIIGFCAFTASQAQETCTQDTSAQTLDITFRRPFPEAQIVPNGDTQTPYSRAEILIGSPNGGTVTVEVWQTGQISVHN